MTWFRRKVQRGEKLGRQIGFPTLNFLIGDFAKGHSAGVYGCEVEIRQRLYRGVLYFGPRLGTGEMTLELYVIDFNQEIYGDQVRFRLLEKVRNAMTFKTLDEIHGQIKKDLEAIEA
jgi:riboflavin kinase/FMN adenylyltransferase